MILSTCDNITMLKVIRIVGIMITFIKILVPVGLVVALSIELLKAIKVGNDDLLAKAKKSAVTKLIAAVIIFLLPTLVNVLINVISSDGDKITSCLKFDISEEEIITIEKENIESLLSRAEAVQDLATYSAAYTAVSSLDRSEDKTTYYERLDAISKTIEEKNKKIKEEADKKKNEGTADSSDTGSGNDGNSGNNTPITTTNITYIDATNLGCTVYYSDHKTVFKELGFNSVISSEIHDILKQVCSYSNSNSNIIPRLETAGAYVNKTGYHGRGLAIDLNNLWSITYNGKTYEPYALYGGTNSNAWSTYNDFVCKVCNGKEDCDKNINYQIYYKYFKPKGWCWGGNWSTSYFDPMHYEKSDNGCSYKKPNISCN